MVSRAPETAPIKPPICCLPLSILCGRPTAPYRLACLFQASRLSLAAFTLIACCLMPAA